MKTRSAAVLPEKREARSTTKFRRAFRSSAFCLGEYDVETKLGAIDYEPAPPSPASLGLRPLGELTAVVDASK